MLLTDLDSSDPIHSASPPAPGSRRGLKLPLRPFRLAIYFLLLRKIGPASFAFLPSRRHNPANGIVRHQKEGQDEGNQ